MSSFVTRRRHPESVTPREWKLDDCSTQRNLSEQGRAHARRLGDAFRAHRVVVGRLLSSPWCRCVETARIAFGEAPQILPALGNLFGRSDRAAAQVAELKPLAGRRPSTGNTDLVSHRFTILALTGVSPDDGGNGGC